MAISSSRPQQHQFVQRACKRAVDYAAQQSISEDETSDEQDEDLDDSEVDCTSDEDDEDITHVSSVRKPNYTVKKSRELQRKYAYSDSESDSDSDEEADSEESESESEYEETRSFPKRADYPVKKAQGRKRKRSTSDERLDRDGESDSEYEISKHSAKDAPRSANRARVDSAMQRPKQVRWSRPLSTAPASIPSATPSPSKAQSIPAAQRAKPALTRPTQQSASAGPGDRIAWVPYGGEKHGPDRVGDHIYKATYAHFDREAARASLFARYGYIPAFAQDPDDDDDDSEDDEEDETEGYRSQYLGIAQARPAGRNWADALEPYGSDDEDDEDYESDEDHEAIGYSSDDEKDEDYTEEDDDD